MMTESFCEILFQKSSVDCSSAYWIPRFDNFFEFVAISKSNLSKIKQNIRLIFRERFSMALQNLNIAVSPLHRCVNVLKDKSLEHGYGYKYAEFQWLCFDKHKKIFFGIRSRQKPNDFSEQEIVMRSVFSHQQMKKIKTLRVSNPKEVERKVFYGSSNCGSYLAIVHASAYPDEKYETVFYLFCVETGQVKRYRLLFSLSVTDLRILHSSTVGWFCKLGSLNYVFKRDNSLHLLNFDHTSHTCSLEPLTDLPHVAPGLFTSNFILWYNQVLVCNHSFNVPHNFALFHPETKRWSVRDLNNTRILDNVNHYHMIFAGCEDDENLFAIAKCFYGNRINHILRLIGNKWENSFELAYEITAMEQSSSISYVRSMIRSSDLLLISMSTLSTIVINTNVLSLKDLAFRSFVHSCNDCSEQVLVDVMDLPCRLKRHYFGPTWTWNT